MYSSKLKLGLMFLPKQYQNWGFSNGWYRYKLIKKRKGTLGQKFFHARVVDLCNELDDSNVAVDNVTAFKKKLEKLGY